MNKVLNFVVNNFPIIPIFLTMKFVHAFWKITCFQCVDITQISWNDEHDGMTHWNDKPLGFHRSTDWETPLYGITSKYF